MTRTGADAPLTLHPDRLLPAEPGVRAIARRLYEAVQGAAVDLSARARRSAPAARERAFADPTSLLITPDHYVTRLLHASGVPLDALGVGQGPLTEDRSREVWRLLCERWDVFRGTAVRYWLEAELAELFGVSVRPSQRRPMRSTTRSPSCLSDDAYRPRALYERFGVEVLATTDDPCDDLSAHAALAADPTWSGRVIPTFRPDRYLEPAEPGWRDAVGAPR